MKTKGFTLIELMIAVAILAVVASIAIPAYQGYIYEARVGAARMNAESLRVFLEDYHLDNSDYRVGGDTSYNKSELQTNFGWRPDGDGNLYTYTVTAKTNNWDITVVHNSGNWLHCDDRMSSCCDGKSGSAPSDCP